METENSIRADEIRRVKKLINGEWQGLKVLKNSLPIPYKAMNMARMAIIKKLDKRIGELK